MRTGVFLGRGRNQRRGPCPRVEHRGVKVPNDYVRSEHFCGQARSLGEDLSAGNGAAEAHSAWQCTQQEPHYRTLSENVTKNDFSHTEVVMHIPNSFQGFKKTTSFSAKPLYYLHNWQAEWEENSPILSNNKRQKSGGDALA